MIEDLKGQVAKGGIPGWHTLPSASRAHLMRCPCGQSIQDAYHAVVECQRLDGVRASVAKAVAGVLAGGPGPVPEAPVVTAGPQAAPPPVRGAVAPLGVRAAVAAMSSRELSRAMMGSKPLIGRAFGPFDGVTRAAAAAVWRAEGPAALKALRDEGGDVVAATKCAVALLRTRRAAAGAFAGVAGT